MSAYLVSHTHIAAIVKYAMFARPYQSHLGCGDFDQAERVCELLAAECVKSVSYRYPHDTPESLPGPIHRSIAVRPTFANLSWSKVPSLSAVAVLKALKGYEYQSCEHPEWEQSDAKQWCDKLQSVAIGALDGYDEAAWDIADVFTPSLVEGR